MTYLIIATIILALTEIIVLPFASKRIHNVHIRISLFGLWRALGNY